MTGGPYRLRNKLRQLTAPPLSDPAPVSGEPRPEGVTGVVNIEAGKSNWSLING